MLTEGQAVELSRGLTDAVFVTARTALGKITAVKLRVLLASFRFASET